MGRDISEIEISTDVNDPVARRSFTDADALHALGATLFTIGLTGPNYEFSGVDQWLAWRDAHNASRPVQ